MPVFRLAQYGRNELAAPAKTSIFQLIAEQFEDKLVQILVAVAVVSSVLSVFEDDPTAFVEPVVIILILIINALVGIWQGMSAEGALDALKKVSGVRKAGIGGMSRRGEGLRRQAREA